MIILSLQILIFSIYGFKISFFNIIKIISIIIFSFSVIFIAANNNIFGIGDRILTIFSYFISQEFSDNSFAERFDLLQAGWNMFAENPIKGVGFGGFEYYSADYMIFDPRSVVAHNTFLTIASEQGVFGILMFLNIFISVVLGCCKKNRKFILVSVVGLCGNMFFLVAHYMPFVYAFLAIFSSLSRFSLADPKVGRLKI